LHKVFVCLPLIDNSLKFPHSTLDEVAKAQLSTDKPYAVYERCTPVVSNCLFFWPQCSPRFLADIIFQLGSLGDRPDFLSPSEQIAMRAPYVHNDDSQLQPSRLKWPICLQVRQWFNDGNAGHRPQTRDRYG
jgi:hypothetical protein